MSSSLLLVQVIILIVRIFQHVTFQVSLAAVVVVVQAVVVVE